MKISDSHFYKRSRVLNKKKLYAILIIFIMLFFGVGYAYLNTTVTINGSATIMENTWDVHFENIEVVDGSVEATSDAVITDDTVIDFTVDLRLPGDVYSFTVDVVNDGTIDAMLNEVLKTGLTTTQEAYVEYTVTYSDGEEIISKDSLPGGKQDQLLVSVKYKDDIEANDLPSENQTIDLTLETDYIQDDGTSDDRRPPRYLYDEIIAQNLENGEMVLDNEASTYVSASTGIDFGVAPSDTNGKGVYVRNGTESDTYPIYYYRGAVTNNNVVFANYCWKIVRTTETGGIKLIYNGEYEHSVFEPIESSGYINVTNDATYAYTYDSATKNWTSTNNGVDDTESVIKFSVATAGYYAINYVVSSEEGWDYAYFYLDDVELGVYSGEKSGSISLGEITSSNVITVKYTKDDYEDSASGSDTVSFNIGLKTGKTIKICNNTGTDSQIGTSKFNSDSEYNAYVGYMYGTPNSSTYEAEHLSTKTSTSSTIKTYIDTWYSQNMTSYTGYLEDTVWCNDRSIYDDPYLGLGTGTGWSTTVYNAYARVGFGSSGNSQPSLECINQNDRFTVNETMEGRINGNGALTYPIALLTADEITLGSGYYVIEELSIFNSLEEFSYDYSMINGYSTKSYLDIEENWWSLSPYINSGDAFQFYMKSNGVMFNGSVVSSYGVRPSLSLKLGTKISTNGDGSPINPFVVE